MNDPTRLANIEKAKQEVDGLKAQRDSFLSGEQSLPYTEKMLFAIDKYLNGAFISMTYDTWLQANKGKTVEELSPAEKQVFKYLSTANMPRVLPKATAAASLLDAPCSNID